MEDIESAVDSLYLFRDHYFESRPLSEAAVKDRLVEDRMRECLQRLDGITISEEVAEVRARSLYQRGRALNILPDHSPEAEALLSKAVKLKPDLVDAWNELGECYVKRGDGDTARTCFEGALRHKSNKVSLRNLSILSRQQTFNSAEDRLRSIEQGLEIAKEAVQLDTADGVSWSILGNAYFMHFFSVSQNPRTLKQAMSAYKQAEKDVIAKSSPDLYYNKGVALKYEEDYQGALDCFERACALDPTWDKARAQEKALWQALADVKNLIDLKGKLKTKRFNSLVESLSSKSLGPFGGGSYSSGRTGVTVSLSEVTSFSQLTEGLNAEKVALGRVVCSVHSEETVPFTFCLADRSGRIVAVNLYNLAPGKGVIIGDSVAIAEPYFTNVKVKKADKTLEFGLIRVDSPLVLVINGKKASPDLQAGVELSTFTKSN